MKIFLYGTMVHFSTMGIEYMTKSLILTKLTKHSSYLDFY